MHRGILFQRLLCSIFELEDVEIKLQLDCVEALKPRDDVGVCVEVDEQVEVAEVAGRSVEIVGALVGTKADQLWVKERVGEGVEIVWLKDPSLLVEGRHDEVGFCSICARMLVLVDTLAKEGERVFVDIDELEIKVVLVEVVLVAGFTVVFFASFLFSDFRALISDLNFFTLFSRFSHFCSNLMISRLFSLTTLFSMFRSFLMVSISILCFLITSLRVSLLSLFSL